MIFEPASLPGAMLLYPKKYQDERGFFTCVWSQETFAAHGLNPDLVQCNVAFNPQKGTLRGLHYQLPPYTEAKLVRCTRGRVFDVGVDLRPDSPTFCQWFGVELSADLHNLVYLPEGLAHGYLTLSENAEVSYQVSQKYVPEAGRGLRWNDPLFDIHWPGEVNVIAARDASYPDCDLTNLPGLWQ